MRLTQTGLLCGAFLVLAACAHTSGNRALTGASDEPRGVVDVPAGSDPASAVRPENPSAAYPIPAIPSDGSVDGTSSGDDALALTNAQYEDLFDRIRAGFKLDGEDRTAIDKQLTWYASHPDYLERAFGRAELYLYHIVSEIEARGMPLELALLPVVESAFEPYAYSRARASGLWQFIPGTGSRFGLKQNWWYDGRRDVVESTRAALDYLQYLHDEFDGDWLLAIAGYNCGEAAVERAIARNRKAGLKTDFWHLKLPAETRAYVPKLLAMKRLVEDPADFELTFSRINNEAYFTRVETYGQIDLRLAAEIAGITHDELYELNPAFHRWATDPAGPHFLLVPTDAAEAFRTNIVLLTPDQRMRVTRYTVQKNDSVASVASEFSTTPQVVRELNDLSNGPLVVGTELRVPSDVVKLPEKVARAAALVDNRGRNRPHVHVVRSGDSLWGIAHRNGISVKTLASMNGMEVNDTLRTGQRLRLTSSSSSQTSSASTPGAGGRKVTYTVRRGDTLTRIASVFQVTVAQLASWNGLTTKVVIRPGQKLTVRLPSRS